VEVALLTRGFVASPPVLGDAQAPEGEEGDFPLTHEYSVGSTLLLLIPAVESSPNGTPWMQTPPFYE